MWKDKEMILVQWSIDNHKAESFLSNCYYLDEVLLLYSGV